MNPWPCLAVFCLLLVSSLPAAEFPGERWAASSPAAQQMDEAMLARARAYGLTGEGSGYVTRHGKLVMSWDDPKRLYDLKSSTKSFGAAALGLAIKDGKMRLSDKARQHHSTLGIPPETNTTNQWLDWITIFHLASQTAGFQKPGGFTPLLFEPGTKWDYSDSGPNWLAECITLAYHKDLDELMFDRVFTPIGISRSDLRWRKSSYRPELIEGVKRREFGAGISANMDAMARFGYLHLREGKWNGKEILPGSFVDVLRTALPAVTNLLVVNPQDYGHASKHYGLLWWNNADGTLTKVPRDAYWSWGLYDSIILVIPSLDIVVARAGQAWQRNKGDDHYDVLKGFFEPIVASVLPNAETAKASPPYPPSPVIKQIKWAPRETISRKAKGSDNWPLTWGDDDALYTAYGDGNGFEPFLPEKLSLGFAKVLGGPLDFQGVNLRSSGIERKGDGARGLKASGILMVNSTLYLLARNATNSQLAWSRDHGENWTWASWRFTSSFGCPTFLNFGRNYAGARDGFVYVYSQDSDSAYQPADGVVLARVSRDEIPQREAYEFFQGMHAGQPVWTSEIQKRAPGFHNPQKCYRSSITYNAPLKRYLLCQVLPGEDPRKRGGFGIYDGPEPWGPWTTVFHTEDWDVGPGESCSFPSKWISDDGKTLYLVFSGQDSFSVRKATMGVKN